MFTEKLLKKAALVVENLNKKQLKLVTAESCTGGLLTGIITEIPGASQILERGYVSYSNEAKIELLTVPTYFIEEYGAVSIQTAIAMVEGALLMSRADIALSITGIAGPDGGTETKPVGTVYIGLAVKDKPAECHEFHFSGTRTEVRLASIDAALDLLLKGK